MYRVPARQPFVISPPVAFRSSWFFSFYSQIQPQYLTEYQAWFMSIDRDHSGTISAQELQTLVIGGTPLGIETATKLVKVFDSNRNGQIDFYEYAALHQFVNFLYNSFVMNDRDRSGTIDCREIHNCLNSAGFALPFHTVNAYFLKYSPAGYPLYFTQFLSLCASIALTRSLFEWSRPMGNGFIQLSLAQLFDITAAV